MSGYAPAYNAPNYYGYPVGVPSMGVGVPGMSVTSPSFGLGGLVGGSAPMVVMRRQATAAATPSVWFNALNRL